jgi:hypothetical protein
MQAKGASLPSALEQVDVTKPIGVDRKEFEKE